MLQSKTILVTLALSSTALACAQSENPPTFTIRVGGGLFSDSRAKAFVGRGGTLIGASYMPRWRSFLAGPHYGDPAVELDILTAQAKGNKLTAGSLMYAERIPFQRRVEYFSEGPYYGIGAGAVQVSTTLPGTFFSPPITKHHFTLGGEFMIGQRVNSHFGIELSYHYLLKTFGFNANTVNATLGYRF